MEKFNLKTFVEQPIADDDQEYIEYLYRLADNDIECHLDHDPFPSPPPEIQLYLDDIWEVQTNIDSLEKELAAQRAKLIAVQRRLKTHLIEKDPIKLSRGKPKENVALQVATKRFVGMWVKSVLVQLGAKNCSDLEKLIPGSDQRNWTRWKRGDAVPTLHILLPVVLASIERGSCKGKRLVDLSTYPPTIKLLDLIHQLRQSRK